MKADASNRIVLDASVAVAWCFEDESTSYAESILDRMAKGTEAVVPALWSFEVGNALLVAERRKRVTAARSAVFLEQLGSFKITVDDASFARVTGRVLDEARQSHLSVYDAAYLELALRCGLPLATLDNSLKKAAKAIGVSLL